MAAGDSDGQPDSDRGDPDDGGHGIGTGSTDVVIATRVRNRTLGSAESNWGIDLNARRRAAAPLIGCRAPVGIRSQLV
jgi:hypothetical protein